MAIGDAPIIAVGVHYIIVAGILNGRCSVEIRIVLIIYYINNTRFAREKRKQVIVVEYGGNKIVLINAGLKLYRVSYSASVFSGRSSYWYFAWDFLRNVCS